MFKKSCVCFQRLRLHFLPYQSFHPTHEIIVSWEIMTFNVLYGTLVASALNNHQTVEALSST